MLQTLTSLRGIFAIFIFFHHIHSGGQSLFVSAGNSAVVFFLMLSGFVLTWAYSRRAMPSYARFVGHRLRRLVPLHRLTLALMVAFLAVYA